MLLLFVSLFVSPLQEFRDTKSKKWNPKYSSERKNWGTFGYTKKESDDDAALFAPLFAFFLISRFVHVFRRRRRRRVM